MGVSSFAIAEGLNLRLAFGRSSIAVALAKICAEPIGRAVCVYQIGWPFLEKGPAFTAGARAFYDVLFRPHALQNIHNLKFVMPLLSLFTKGDNSPDKYDA